MEPFDCNLLQDGGHSSHVLWSLKRFDPQGYKFAHPRTPKQIKSDVLSSRRVQHAIEKTAVERSETIDNVTSEVETILEEMGHNFNLSSIRVMAVMLRKILCTLFKKVLINREGVERLRDAAKNNPVVFVPSHRSYMDFLLVSYVCFATDIPLPFIAAAADFMNMRVIRTLFRNSGAFYMRRSFMSDPLYWVVFTEYIQNQLQTGNQPLEFFLEGTRSRTGKFLHPKLGVLSMVVDLYANARVPDILICPISISYDRVLEESPCAFELLGIPKPKESLGGLIKSRFVLTENYGSIHIHVGELLPLSRFTAGKLNRADSACIPRHLFHFLSEEQKKVVKSLGYKILSDLQAGMINSPCILVASLMLQNLQGLQFDELVEKFTWLKELCNMWQIPIKSSGETDNVFLVNESLDLLKSSLEQSGNGYVKIRGSKMVESGDQSLASSPPKEDAHFATAARNIQQEAAIHIQLAYKRNAILFYFFRTGMLSLAAHKQADPEKDLVQLLADFQFLTQLLVKEVASIVDQTDESFQPFRETVHLLEQHGSVYVKNSRLTILQEKDITFSADMWRPILTAYWIACQFFLNLPDSVHQRPLIETVKLVQDKAAELILTGDIRYHEVLSLDMLKNAVLALVDVQAVKASKSVDGGILISVPSKGKVSDVYQKIGEFLDIHTNAAFFPQPLSKL